MMDLHDTDSRADIAAFGRPSFGITIGNDESGEFKVEQHDIGWAVRQLEAGERVYRQGWNGPNQHLEHQVPDANSKMTLPYIYITTVQGHLVPWVCSQTDLLAVDWEVRKL